MVCLAKKHAVTTIMYQGVNYQMKKLIEEDRFNILRLLNTRGVGYKTANRILSWCSTTNINLAEFFAKIENNENIQLKLNRDIYENLKVKDDKIFAQLDALEEKEIGMVSITQFGYPVKLSLSLYMNAPPVLFYRGNLEILHRPGVGFCGSRNATERGIQTAHDCAEQLGYKGINIISGYATGVDITTHKAAMGMGGYTTIVLPEGILNFRVRKELKEMFDEKKTLVFSEFLPNLPWSVNNAMTRNATICGLADIMILIEAKVKGGSFDAGNKALEMGRPLFVPVYEGMPEEASANSHFLTKGAYKVLKNEKTNKANLKNLMKKLLEVKDIKHYKFRKTEEQEKLFGC